MAEVFQAMTISFKGSIQQRWKPDSENEIFLTEIALFFQKSVEKNLNDPMIKSCFEDHCALFFTKAKFHEKETAISKSVLIA